jgi:uncharacterized protein (DUF427 family)
VVFNGVTIADTRRAKRVLETSHPPVYYIPLADIRQDCLIPVNETSYCEFKGTAGYSTVAVGERKAVAAAWYYARPTPEFAALTDHVAFYPGKMDACTVDGEPVRPQPGNFYGGWITHDIVGPFKGEPGTSGW